MGLTSRKTSTVIWYSTYVSSMQCMASWGWHYYIINISWLIFEALVLSSIRMTLVLLTNWLTVTVRKYEGILEASHELGTSGYIWAHWANRIWVLPHRGGWSNMPGLGILYTVINMDWYEFLYHTPYFFYTWGLYYVLILYIRFVLWKHRKRLEYAYVCTIGVWCSSIGVLMLVPPHYHQLHGVFFTPWDPKNGVAYWQHNSCYDVCSDLRLEHRVGGWLTHHQWQLVVMCGSLAPILGLVSVHCWLGWLIIFASKKKQGPQGST